MSNFRCRTSLKVLTVSARLSMSHSPSPDQESFWAFFMPTKKGAIGSLFVLLFNSYSFAVEKSCLKLLVVTSATSSTEVPFSSAINSATCFT